MAKDVPIPMFHANVEHGSLGIANLKTRIPTQIQNTDQNRYFKYRYRTQIEAATGIISEKLFLIEKKDP